MQGRDEPYTLKPFTVTSWENSQHWEQGDQTSKPDPAEVNELILFRHSADV